MKKPAKIDTCPICVHDGGIHYSDDLLPVATRPHHDQARQVAQAHALTELAHEGAKKAARALFVDFARANEEFSGNDIRHVFDAAEIPDPLNGATFSWAASNGATDDGPLIEATGRQEWSTENTTRHKINVWRSRVYRARPAVAS